MAEKVCGTHGLIFVHSADYGYICPRCRLELKKIAQEVGNFICSLFNR